MAPKKPAKVTSSSTKAARIKSGSNPVVTQGAARNRTARTTLGPAPKQRPMATGGTKGPLQGGTRTGGQFGAPAPTRPMPSGRGQGPLPNPNMSSRLSDKPKPAVSRGITMSGDRAAAIKAGGQKPAPKPAFGPVPTGPSEARIRSMEAGPGKVRAGMASNTSLSSKPGANAAKAQAGKDAARMANRIAKGYGKPGRLEAGLRQAAGMGMTAARVARGVTPAGVAYETLKARPTAAGTLPPGKFANARDLAFAKAKGIKGSPVLGGKKSAAASFDSAFAAARKAGKATFTHKGKKYNTKMK